MINIFCLDNFESDVFAFMTTLSDPILDTLKAKDDDLKVYETENGEIVLETDLRAAESIGLVTTSNYSFLPEPPTTGEVFDEELVQREAQQPLVDVTVEVVTFMFMINALVCLCILLLGSIPYWFLSYDETRNIAIIFLGVCIGAFSSSYAIMLYFRKDASIVKYMFIIWAFCFILLSGAMASVVQDLAPFQLAAMCWIQSIAVFIYGRLERRSMSPWICFIIMLLTGLLTWLIDIYAFIHFKDWITAGILLVLGLFISFYGMLQVKWANRYNVSFEQKMLAVIQFYADPILMPLSALKRWYNREPILDDSNLETESI